MASLGLVKHHEFGSNQIDGLTYGDGLYVAGGVSGTMTTSTDGSSYLSLELKAPVTSLS